MTTFAITLPDWFLYFASIMLFINAVLGIIHMRLRRKIAELREEQNRLLRGELYER